MKRTYVRPRLSKAAALAAITASPLKILSITKPSPPPP
jgi:hypothetical protein